MRPHARSLDLIVSHSGPDTLIYDTLTHRLHTLNATSTAIWRHCTGAKSIAGIATAVSGELEAPISEATVEMAIRDLATAELLTGHEDSAVSSTRHSRRALMAKAGLGGVVLPVVVSVTMASAAAAASGLDCIPPTVSWEDCFSGGMDRRCCTLPPPFEGSIGYCGETCNPF